MNYIKKWIENWKFVKETKWKNKTITIQEFSKSKEQIRNVLNAKGDALGIQEPVSLIDGFINQPIYNELTRSFMIGGPTIPMIAVVGNSGRIYFFALKALFPNIKI